MGSKGRLKAWMEPFHGTIQFLKRDVWRIRQKDLPPKKSFLLRLLRILILSIRGIMQDRGALRASALTFYSMLSVVPVLAMIFGIAKGFGFEKGLEKTVLKGFEGQEEVAVRIIGFSQALLENVKGGLVAGIGLVILFYTIIMILSHIENAFNDIWGIKKGRSFGRKITDYLSMILLGTILFIMSSSLTVFVTSGVQLVTEKISILQFLRPGVFFLVQFLPYVALWVLFSFMYIFLPNAKINMKSGIIGGVIAGTLYHFFQWGYISLQIGVSKYNAVYGSFAALPLFFIWLRYSWLIVLFGAEISFGHQNVETYEFEEDCLTVSQSFKRLLSLRVAHLLVKRFSAGERPWDAATIAHELEIPVRLVNQILFELVESGVASEVRVNQDKDVGYEPARDPNTITIKYVIEALERLGSDSVPVAKTEALSRISASLEAFGELVERSEANKLLKEV
jgi:membrane protein